MDSYQSTIKLTMHRCGPLIDTKLYKDTKDPCPVFDGKQWHLYGSGGSSGVEKWRILHATAMNPEGPWQESEPVELEGISGPGIAAPGVVYDRGKYHMFIQTDFIGLDGQIEYLVSEEGSHFTYVNTVLRPLQHTITPEELKQMQKSHPEAGLYDSHPAIINGEKYMVYSGMSEVHRPDIYLAKSTTNRWEGPWERERPSLDKSPIFMHEEIIHHNQKSEENYEWGLEGAQIIQLPNKLILLTAVCFLPEGKPGTRQRVFFAVARKPVGPYQTIGHILTPSEEGWESGENGHAAMVITGNTLRLFYQARPIHGYWRYGLASIDVKELQNFCLFFI